MLKKEIFRIKSQIRKSAKKLKTRKKSANRYYLYADKTVLSIIISMVGIFSYDTQCKVTGNIRTQHFVGLVRFKIRKVLLLKVNIIFIF